MRKLQVDLNFNNTSNTFIGTLAEVDKGKIYFEYNKDYLAEGHNISPFKLDFKTGLQINKDRYPTGYFGVFNDSLPDAWGTLLMDRIFLKNNIPLQNITIIDRLSYIGNNAMGALAYVPSTDLSPVINDGKVDLYKLSQNALEVIQGKAEVILPTIFKLGGSPGGARPKILVSGFVENSEKMIYCFWHIVDLHYAVFTHNSIFMEVHLFQVDKEQIKQNYEKSVMKGYV